ncbi:MAG: 6-bladed beta-propeller [Bacteroidales bacterium]|nr:6-bladed beta-propeller [Bacteroidales bacterium]
MKTSVTKTILRIKGILFFCAVVMGMVSCTSGRNGAKSGVLPVLNFDQAMANIEEIKLSDYAESIRYIPIETKEGALVSSSQKIIPVYPMGDAGFFFRASLSEKCGAHHFSPEGKYINSIGTRGRAKGEFVFNTYVLPLPDRNEVVIGGPQNMVVYGLDNEYIWDITFAGIDELEKYNARFWGQFYLGDGKFGRLMGANNGIGESDPNLFMYVYSKDNECEELYPVIREETMEFSFGNGPEAVMKQSMVAIGRFFTVGEEHYYLRNVGDTLFMFGENFKLEPVFTFEYGKVGIANKTKDYENKIKIFGNDFGELMKIGNSYLVPFSIPAELYPEGMPYYSNQNEGIVLFDPQSSRARIFSYNPTVSMTGFVNDLDGGLPFYPSAITKNKMYQVIDPITLLEKVEYVESEELKALAETLGEESNPVIVEVTLK